PGGDRGEREQSDREARRGNQLHQVDGQPFRRCCIHVPALIGRSASALRSPRPLVGFITGWVTQHWRATCRRLEEGWREGSLATNTNAPDSAAPAHEETRWESRRFAAWSLRAGIVIAPVIVAVVVMAIVSRVVPRPRSGSLTLVAGWWALVLASSVIALWVADRAARRLTPLAALLDLAVLFPGRAPTRFAIARKAGDLRALQSL